MPRASKVSQATFPKPVRTPVNNEKSLAESDMGGTEPRRMKPYRQDRYKGRYEIGGGALANGFKSRRQGRQTSVPRSVKTS